MKFVFPIAILLVTVCELCFQSVGAVVFPPAFSNEHKAYSKPNPTFVDIIRMLSKFEIDSHIEVVLVGQIFTESVAGDLSRALEVLSVVSSQHSPFQSIHEKLVYHISIGKTLEREIETAFNDHGKVIEPSIIEKIFTDYHNRASTFTTLFILHRADFSRSYVSSLRFCSQRSFISPNGLAWLDLSAKSSEIYPSTVRDNILPVPNFEKITNLSFGVNIHEIASLIHRSGEALVPVPFIRLSNAISFPTLRNFDQLVYRGGRAHNVVNLVLFTICADYGHVGVQCHPDERATKVMDEIILLYSSSFMRLVRTEIRLVQCAYVSEYSCRIDWHSS